MTLNADQEKVASMLRDTISLMCKNGLKYSSEVCIEGLLGITVDKKDVFLVSIKETLQDVTARAIPAPEPSSSSSCPQRGARRRKAAAKRVRICENATSDASDGDSDWAAVPRKRSLESHSQDQCRGVAIKQEVVDEDDKGPELDSAPSANSSNAESSFELTPNLEASENSLDVPPDVKDLLAFDKLQCHLCHRTFHRGDQLQTHLDNHRKGFYKYSCPFCKRVFSCPTNLKGHVDQHHTNTKSFACKICGKAYSYRTSLNYHVKNAHTDLGYLADRADVADHDGTP